jgi:hypothetical protein
MTNDEGMTKHKSNTLAPARAHNPSRGMGPRSEVGDRRPEIRDRRSEATAGSSLSDELEYFLITWMASERVQLGIILGPILLFVTEVWEASFQQIQSCVDIA